MARNHYQEAVNTESQRQDVDVMWMSLCAAFMICLGHVMAHSGMCRRSFLLASLGGLLSLGGWAMLLYTQHDPSPSKSTAHQLWLKGLGVPVISLVIFAYVALVDTSPLRITRITVMGVLWAAYVSVWLYYAHSIIQTGKHGRKGRGKEAVDTVDTVAAFVWTGLVCMVTGMIGYTFLRATDGKGMYCGKEVPDSHGTFDPFLVVFTFGWLLIAFGNAYTHSNLQK